MILRKRPMVIRARIINPDGSWTMLDVQGTQTDFPGQPEPRPQ
jgi:hypothetical protein